MLGTLALILIQTRTTGTGQTPTEALAPDSSMFQFANALDNTINLCLIVALIAFLFWLTSVFDDWYMGRKARKLARIRNRRIESWMGTGRTDGGASNRPGGRR